MLISSSLDKKKSISTALCLLSVGLLVLSCGAAWQRTFALVLHLGAAGDDFFHGFSTGLGLTLEICALVMLVRVKSHRAKQ